MFLKQKLSKTAKSTIVKNYGRLKGGGQAQGPPPKYATEHDPTVITRAWGDECSPPSQVAADLWTKPIGLGHKPAFRLQVTCTHQPSYYYLARKLILILPSCGRWKAQSTSVAG